MPAPITNIVVLMLENRSYDNVLGMLYSPANDPPYQQAPGGQSVLWGLTGKESNPLPSGGSITVAPATGTTVPTVDPGERFADMAQQILGLAQPPDATTNPYFGWQGGTYGPQGGFVANYAAQNFFGTNSVPAEIMMYMTPAQMPVTAFLANNYMICDGWFGSVPSNTFANRLFSLCASSGTWTSSTAPHPVFSYIDDQEYLGSENNATPVFGAAQRLVMPSLFSQLDAVLGVTQHNAHGAAFPSWKLYFHDYSNTSGLLQYVVDRFADPTSLNVSQYDLTDYTPATTLLANKNFTTFQQDLAAGTLAPFTLIEPRYCNDYPWGGVHGLQVQSNHPGVQGYAGYPGSPQIDVVNGEALLLDVYTQLWKSAYWASTLLLVVYDEHGGCYDSVQPISNMKPPTTTTPPTYAGFNFTWSGPRVPAIIVSPFAVQGSTLRATSGVFDHTSIVKTAWDCFDLGRNNVLSLNDRDAVAASIFQGLSDTAVNETGLPPVSP